MSKHKMEETFGGYILHNVPFPTELDEAALASLKKMAPILIEQPYAITYLHSFGQDSPFFAGLANGRFLTTRDPETGYTYGTPRGHDMYSGSETEWIEAACGRQNPCLHRLPLRQRGVFAGMPLHPGANRDAGSRYVVFGPTDWA